MRIWSSFYAHIYASKTHSPTHDAFWLFFCVCVCCIWEREANGRKKAIQVDILIDNKKVIVKCCSILSGLIDCSNHFWLYIPYIIHNDSSIMLPPVTTLSFFFATAIEMPFHKLNTEHFLCGYFLFWSDYQMNDQFISITAVKRQTFINSTTTTKIGRKMDFKLFSFEMVWSKNRLSISRTN